MRWTAIIAAGGRGERFGRPKQFVEIAGLPMLGWSVRAFASMREVEEIVVAVDAGLVTQTQALLAELAAQTRGRVVGGGHTRGASVGNALAAAAPDVDAVLVHDGARPLVRVQNVRAGMRAVRPGRASVLASRVVDTVKLVDNESLLVQQTLDRDRLWAAQTPQFAMRSDLAAAYRDGAYATDDTALLERAGVEVVVVPSRHANFKITLPEDIGPAELLLRERLAQGFPEPDAVLVEIFAGSEHVDAILRLVGEHGGRVDGIERDLPKGAAVRAYVAADRLHAFEASFVPLADGSATITVHDTAAGGG
ncbi:MAG: 2-C-methyl-D-erythritol 4-phosphate cytidylyltransferase [Candidatus Tyrphobacter sp.]